MRSLIWLSLQYLGINAIERYRHRRTPLVIYYHGVSDVDVAEDPFRPFATVKDFTQHLELLGEHYKVVSLSDMVELHRKNPESIDRHIAITFDDGFLNNLTVAWPILQKYGFPATIFLATDLMGESLGDLWRDYMATHILFSEENEIEFGCGGLSWRLSLGGFSFRREILDKLYHAIHSNNSITQDEIDHVVNSICSQLTPAVGSQMAERYQFMSWSQAEQAGKQGMSFASHTCRHVYLSRCSEEQLKRELLQSRIALDTHLGEKPEHKMIAYPYGDVDGRVVEAIKQAGYTAAFATSQLVSPFGKADINSFMFPRQGIGYGENQLQFCSAICGTREKVISLKRKLCGREQSPIADGCTLLDLMRFIGAEQIM